VAVIFTHKECQPITKSQAIRDALKQLDSKTPDRQRVLVIANALAKKSGLIHEVNYDDVNQVFKYIRAKELGTSCKEVEEYELRMRKGGHNSTQQASEAAKTKTFVKAASRVTKPKDGAAITVELLKAAKKFVTDCGSIAVAKVALSSWEELQE
jgi:hypothetical protein